MSLVLFFFHLTVMSGLRCTGLGFAVLATPPSSPNSLKDSRRREDSSMLTIAIYWEYPKIGYPNIVP